MTLVSLPSPIAWPGLTGYLTTNPALGTEQTLDAAGEYQAYVYVAREDMVISHVMFRAGTVVAAPTCTVGIEALDGTTGVPTGSAGFGSTNGTTATISSNTTVLTALGGSATITKGTHFAVKITYASGTSVIVQRLTSINPISTSLPYAVTNVSGSAVKAQITTTPIIGLGSSSTVFYSVPGAFPATAAGLNAFNNTSSAKRGLRFVPPMACRAVGMRWHGSGALGDYNAVLYNDAGTELSSSSTAFDGDNVNTNSGPLNVYFDSPVTLTAGTAYRIAIEPTSATNVNVSTVTLPSSDYFSATPAGSAAVYATFATATWTDSTTQLPYMDVLLDQLDDGAGSGGTTVIGVIGG